MQGKLLQFLPVSIMPAPHETAYPRLKSEYSADELLQLYTPTRQEVAYIQRYTPDPTWQVVLLTNLKVFQRLGYFLHWRHIPLSVTRHVTQHLGQLFEPTVPSAYEASGTRSRHTRLIRDFMGVHAVGNATWLAMQQAARRAAQTKEHLADIINAMLEELIKERMELPAFSTFVRQARTARSEVNQQCYQRVARQLTPQQKDVIDALLVSSEQPSLWEQLKQEPTKPTSHHVRDYLGYAVDWNKLSQRVLVPLSIPQAKQDQFYYEAYASNLTDMKRFPAPKRYTFALLLLTRKRASVLDDLVLIFIKLVQGLHTKAKLNLETYHASQRERVEGLISQLADITTAFQGEGTVEQRWAAVAAAMPADTQHLINQCHQHLAYAHNNYYLCLPLFYRSKRSLLFDILTLLPLQSSSSDHSLPEALSIIQQHRHGRKEWIGLPHTRDQSPDRLDLDWLPDKWRKLVTGRPGKEAQVDRIHRKYFELCVFTELMRQLKSGDVFVVGSRDYDDYRDHLLDWEQVNEQLATYRTLTGVPTDGAGLCRHLQEWLLSTAHQADQTFPVNAHVRIENGQVVLNKPVSPPPPADEYTKLDRWLKERMQPVNILEIILKTEKWLNLSRHFYPLSGYEPRLEEYPERWISTLFCYGCHLGPAQTARSIPGLNRKQLAWVNAHHVTEERLNVAINQVINSYNQFSLPQYWGSGKRASADGTKWNLYEQNLLSEYHIRYGGYGGIGYYHVADTYIALFSHFIPCGVYEAIYILDGLLKNTSDVQPDTLHGDTQSQSVAVFGLAYLLGIKLMPRIRGLKDLTLFRPDRETSFRYIDALFSESINWNLIETHTPDMLRVVLSIQAGKIAPSTILRRLGTFSRKNKLYFAFRELGRVVRTQFLLEYIQDERLRRTIQAATAKSEEFNEFTKWLSFGNPETITENLRHEQQKMVKYNHLVANMLILYNVDEMTRVLSELLAEGYPIDESVLAYLSPYRREHVNRFGHYTVDMHREVPPLRVDVQLFGSCNPL